MPWGFHGNSLPTKIDSPYAEYPGEDRKQGCGVNARTPVFGYSVLSASKKVRNISYRNTDVIPAGSATVGLKANKVLSILKV